MEENENLEFEVSATLKNEIEAKVKEFKDADSKLKTVYPIVIQGAETDEKETYVAYFRQPNFVAFSKYLSFSQKDQVSALRQLARDIFLGGDRDLIDDDSLFLFGLMGQLSKIIEMRTGTLVNLSKPGK